MPASYPSSVKSFTAKTDDVDDVMAVDVNELQLEVAAIETTLGANLVNAQGIKGWIQLNGTGTPAIADSYNVSGIVDNGTGDYTVTWDTDFANDDYAVVGMAGLQATQNYNIILKAIAAGSTQVQVNDGSNLAADAAVVMLIAIGDR